MNMSRQDFLFPYTPYPSQVEFMKCLYSALDTGRLAIMESPTGTGKSMSLICGSLAWLKDFEAAEINRLKEKSSVVIKDVGDDWFSAQAQQIEVKHEANVAKKSILDIEQHLKKISLYPTQLKKHRELSEYGNSNSRKIPVKAATSDKDTETVDLDLILVNDGTELKEEDEDELEEKTRLPKIIYCSRTHSQLAQFVSEIKKSPYSKDVRVVTLGSRQNYCVNESVKNFKSSHLINEKCLELRQNKPKSSGPSAAKKQKRDHCKYGCNSNGLEILRMSAMTAVLDVEDLFKLGQKEEACPYYGAKACVDDAQVVVAPYNILLLKESREVYGIKLEGNIVIIDEAHNLLETESSIHSAEVSLMQLKCAHSQLAQYLDRFIGKLNPANLLKIRQLLHVHVKLLAALEKKTGDVESVYLMDEFLNETELMDYNLIELVEFAGKSRLAQKLNGFTARYNPTLEIQIQKQSSTPAKTGVQGFLSKLNQNKVLVKVPEAPVTQPTILEAGVGVNPILPVLTFIKMLVCHSESGRIVCHSGQQQNSIKFLLLNPGSMFHDVVSKSRAVILAGGTMKPTWDVRHELFNDSERIEEHSFQHVVPPENVLPLVLSKASTGSCTFDFSYESRGNRNMIKALGETLINISSVIPNGMVVFFPSHKYLQLVCKVWKEEGLDKNLERHKKLFREPDSMNKVDAVLKDYAVHCNPTKDAAKGYGAMLLSVVGGRLSEGINFSNELCRCVAVVGLPYPNIKSPELIAKMQYQKSKFKSVSGGKDPASEYYNNLCMKAVNQCIGRAIRHQNDYAAMLLLDQRYQAQHVRSALPSWIENNLTICKDFNVGRSSLQKFFGRHKV